MNSTTTPSRIPAHALFLALAFAALPLQAAQTRAPSLAEQLTRSAALPPAPQLKDEDFARRSRLAQVKLSPDGATLAFLESDGKDNALYVMDLTTSARKQLLPVSGRQELHWSSDSKIIFMSSGDGVAQVALADGASSKIAAFDRKLEQQFVSVDPSQPQAVLTESFDRAAKVFRISRVGADGKSQVIYEGERKVHEFLVDPAGQVSFIRTLEADFSQLVLRRADGKWTEAARCKKLRACQLVSATPDQRQLSMIVNYQDDRKALVSVDTRSGAQRLVHSDPLRIADLGRTVLAPASPTPLLAVYDAPQRRNIGLTPAATRAAADIAKRFPDSNVIMSPSAGAARWLLTERGARLQQDRHWLYEAATRRITPVLAAERARAEPLAEQHLAAKIPVQYRGSDGARLHGYLSLPPGKDPATVPLLTMVHGGPWGRFDNDYTTLVQLAVNRGAAVFQPNFRASTGHGDKYMLAPGADFGNGRVQADIIDGVRYLLANGVGDKNRVAIMGDSFGGYSTLLALSHTPDLFKFGMATVPPTDFVRTMTAAAKGPAYGDEAPFAVTLAEMGIDLGDGAAMKKINDAAPAFNADKITRPLLILAGGKDHIVDVAGVTDYVARLQGKDKPVGLLLDPDEGHNPRKPIVRQAYSHLLQRMMHQHLGTAAPAEPSPELAKYLEQTLKVNTVLK
ncbi:prolyl oligopeptidase family serine peptidase [Massilia sp. PAMC28688]|uniref:S9 family peptidase n=1 Tax=Massilia sp. PAMC28688 TaxID=2861283 RepID=UPI001C638C62|nr:prolyl oligopeptidase family serine peptidase [Massilia sp. PAMC28688]QYF91861.1 prolyl oligopeptidase family serine peptidase [Massilia sp. PAMC28688]